MSAGYGGAPRLADRFEAHKGLDRKAHEDLQQQHLIWNNHAATADLRRHRTASFGDRLVRSIYRSLLILTETAFDLLYPALRVHMYTTI